GNARRRPLARRRCGRAGYVLQPHGPGCVTPVLATNVIRADSGGEVRVVKDVVTAASRNRSRQQRPSSGSSLVDWMRSRGRHLLHWSAGGGGAEPARRDAWQPADRWGARLWCELRG